MELKVQMKSGKVHELTNVKATLQEITKTLNKDKFIQFGPLILSCDEIESITKV